MRAAVLYLAMTLTGVVAALTGVYLLWGLGWACLSGGLMLFVTGAVNSVALDLAHRRPPGPSA